jgi:hypothetical protein
VPFDGTDFARREIKLGKIDKVMSMLDTAEKWCQNQLKTADGRRCILGALIAVGARRHLYGLIVASAREATGIAFMSVEQFNDHPMTDHKLVMAVLNAAHYRLQVGDVPFAERNGFPLWKRFLRSLCAIEI